MPDRPVTNRSHEFIRSFQVEAVCEALHFCMASHIDPGPTLYQVVKRLRDDFVASGTGRAIEYIPDVSEIVSAKDLYLAAEFLRATVLSFLTPEEREERASFGLSSRWNGGAKNPPQWTGTALSVLVILELVGAVPAIERWSVMPSNTTQNPHLLDYSQRRPRRRSRWLWIVGTLLMLGVIGSAVAYYVIVPAYSIHKRRELNIQAGVLNAAPTTSKLVREWHPDAARGEQAYQNWMRGPNAYDSVDAKAAFYPILRAGMLQGTERRAVLVWLDAERSDGFDIEYAVIEPGSRFSPSRLVNLGTQAFNGATSQQPIRVWSATITGDRSRFVFDYQIAGVRQSAEATLAGSKLSFKTGAAPSPQ